MKPYYLLKCAKFDSNIAKYGTPAQLNMSGILDRIAYTKIEKKQSLKNFFKYKLTCELPQDIRGRAYGHEDIFEGFILIKEESLYYNSPNKLAILSCKKEVFKKFINDFNCSDAYKYFEFKKFDVDFRYILKNQNSLGIEGVWFGDTGDINVEHMYLLGYEIQASEKYEELLRSGAKIKNITIIYKFKDTNHKIMITKDGGVIIYRHLDENDALDLILDVHLNLFI